ncbi:MAG: Arc family DNA-binding protein [Peptostreptococcaceae bacterium]|nr:Arc family DNA-binding protein [Peptostreptococcaceae bacterium]
MRDREIKEQLSIRLPIDWVDRIHQIAEKERKSMNQVINELVEKAFNNS